MDASTSLTRWSYLYRYASPQNTTFVITTTAVATATLLYLAKRTLWPGWDRVLPNPLKTTLAIVQREDEDEQAEKRRAELKGMVYHPDVLPGGRDVDTPYGTIRVYEYGPEDGEKVLFVHGISTPCITLSLLANRLVERGCRVMLFDLFGRGFSDGVGDLPHDARLYVSQMLLALASSPLSWTGANAMSLVGYSLGGGIAVHFANSFPHLVSSLVLLAPAGLIRSETFGTVTSFIFRSGLVPERILARLTSIRLQQPIAAARKPKTGSATHPAPFEVAEAVHMMKTDDNSDAPTPLEERLLGYVRWMVVHHVGFIPSFMSSIRYAPLIGQHDSWKLLSKRRAGTTLVLLAEKDEIINLDDYLREVVRLTGGNGQVDMRIVPGAHDFVMTHVNEVYQQLDEWMRH